MKLISKKILVGFFIFALVAAAGVFAVFFHSSEITVNKDNPTASATKKAGAPSDVDSDNDGLADWQEQIYSTDPYRSDTDGDGFTDGEEVAHGYNPLVAGNGKGSDKLVDVKTVGARERPKYLSENIEANMFSGIAGSTPEEVVNQPDDSEDLLYRLMAVFSDADVANETFTGAATQVAGASAASIKNLIDPPLPAVILQNETDTQESRQEYINKIAAVASDLRKQTKGNNNWLLMLSNAFSDIPVIAEKATGELKNLADAHTTATDALCAIRPPKSFYQFHMKYTKSIESLSVFLSTLQDYKADRVKAAIFLEFSTQLFEIQRKVAGELTQLMNFYNLDAAAFGQGIKK